jgi:hypothetical protein
LDALRHTAGATARVAPTSSIEIAIEIEIGGFSLTRTSSLIPTPLSTALQLSAVKKYCQLCKRAREILLYSQIEKKH